MAKPDANTDLQTVDWYLTTWDRFACGANDLGEILKTLEADFQAALTRLLEAQHPSAPSRMVFYPVVMVGGFIPIASRLGSAIALITNGEVAPYTNKQGEQSYFAGDLYLWWEAHQNEYEPFALFNEWRDRDFARLVVIPGYRKMCQK